MPKVVTTFTRVRDGEKVVLVQNMDHYGPAGVYQIRIPDSVMENSEEEWRMDSFLDAPNPITLIPLVSD